MQEELEEVMEKVMNVAILCKNPQKLAAAMHFLRKRDISATAFNNLGDFLTGMKEQNFDIMLISLNFNHQKPDKIPTLMQQMFQLPVIVFCETKDAATQVALHAGFKYKIPDQATGPAIAMAIARTVRDLEMEAALKDGERAPNRSRISQGANSEDHHRIISLPRDGSPDEAYVSRGGQNKDSNIYINQGSTLNTLAYHDHGHRDGGASLLDGAELDDLGQVEMSLNNLADQDFDPMEPIKSASGLLLPRNSAKRALAKMPRRRGKFADHAMEAADRELAANPRFAKDLSMDSVALWVCAVGAVNSIAGPDAEVIQQVANPEICNLLSLRTPKAQGTFVILVGEEMQGAADIGSYLVEELFNQMDIQNFGRPSRSEFDVMEVAPYLIQDEVLERARFYSARQGPVHQIGMTFVNHANMLSYADFDDDSLIEVPLASIQPEQILDFPLYLKMQVTRRYMTYVNDNGWLSANQAVRLSGYGIRSFFINKDDHDRYLLHVARQEVQEELKKRGLRLIKRVG